LILALVYSSCASVLNREYTYIDIKTSEPSSVVIGTDTLKTKLWQIATFIFENKKEPIKVTVFNENKSKSVLISSKKNAIYWANLVTPYFLGFVVDEVTKKKFVYPKKVYIDLDNSNENVLTYFPFDYLKLNRKNMIGISMLSSLNQINPMLKVHYERMHGRSFATRLSYGHLLSYDNDYARNSRGFNISLEEKYFFINDEKSRFYFSVALDFLSKTHEADMSFSTDPDPEIGSTFEQRIDIQKTFSSLTPRIGVQNYLGKNKRFVAEFVAGVGIRYRETKFLDTDPLLFNWYEFTSPHQSSGRRPLQFRTNKERSEYAPNLNINFSLSWVF